MSDRLQELQVFVRAAESGGEVTRARHDLTDMQQMFDKGFVSEAERSEERRVGKECRL